MAVAIAAKAGGLQTVLTLVAVNAGTQKRKNARETNKSQAEYSKSELKALKQAK